MSIRNQIFSFLWFIMLIFPGNVISQNTGKEKTDALLARLARHQPEDTLKVLLYDSIAFGFYSRDPQQGIGYGKAGIALAEKLNYSRGLVLCLISTGVCFWASADYPDALGSLLQALKVSEQTKNKPGIAKASGNLGNVYADQEQYDKAMAYYTLALQISRELKDTIGIARKLGNIGTIFKEQNKSKEALEYYKNALFFYEAAAEKRGIAVTLANIGWAYSEQSMYVEALKYFNRALEIARETEEMRWVMFNYGTIGELYYKMATDDTSGSYRSIFQSLTRQQKDGYLALSLAYSTSAVTIAKEIKADKQLIGWRQIQTNSFMQLGNYKKAYEYLLLTHQVKDSLFAAEIKLKVANLDAKRENEVKAKEIQLQKTRLEKATIQRVAMVGGLIGLIIIIFVIYQSRRKSEQLLLNMLPAKIARRLKNKERPIADKFTETAVVFIDIVGFTHFSKDKKPEYIVAMLNDFFQRMDFLSEKHHMEKIKTIGDCYMAVCGLPDPNPASVECAARFALETRDMMRTYSTPDGQQIRVRIGIDSGSVVAGVIGEKKYSYDLWGDTVNTASRMESLGIEGEIQITDAVQKKLDGRFITRSRGDIEVKGKGHMNTWILEKSL